MIDNKISALLVSERDLNIDVLVRELTSVGVEICRVWKGVEGKSYIPRDVDLVLADDDAAGVTEICEREGIPLFSTSQDGISVLKSHMSRNSVGNNNSDSNGQREEVGGREEMSESATIIVRGDGTARLRISRGSKTKSFRPVFYGDDYYEAVTSVPAPAGSVISAINRGKPYNDRVVRYATFDDLVSRYPHAELIVSGSRPPPGAEFRVKNSDGLRVEMRCDDNRQWSVLVLCENSVIVTRSDAAKRLGVTPRQLDGEIERSGDIVRWASADDVMSTWPGVKIAGAETGKKSKKTTRAPTEPSKTTRSPYEVAVPANGRAGKVVIPDMSKSFREFVAGFAEEGDLFVGLDYGHVTVFYVVDPEMARALGRDYIVYKGRGQGGDKKSFPVTWLAVG